MLKKILFATIAVLIACSTVKSWADIIDAIETNDIAYVKHCLDNGVYINTKDEYGRPLLHLAAYHGYDDIAKLLIARGADVNAKDGAGYTPLIFAKAMGGSAKSPSIAKILIEHGADVNYKNKVG